jgi:hypothetical protein
MMMATLVVLSSLTHAPAAAHPWAC